MTGAHVIADDAALAAFAPEWLALWARVPDAPPFSSPSWLLPWWRQFGTGAPRVATLRRAGALVAVLPMYRLVEKTLPIGAGITDYQDALCAPDAPADAAATLLAAILLRAEPDAECELIDVPPDAALRTATPPPGWRGDWRESDPCPVLDLHGARRLEDAIPPRIARKLRMNRNRAERVGGFESETATPATAPALLDALVRLHQARWNDAGEPGVLGDPRVLAFHRDAAPGLVDAGAMRLAVLRFGTRTVAACMALTDAREKIFFYLSGYDAAHAHESPGSILLGEMLAQAIAEGRREAHFLRGPEPYKYAWGGVDRRNAACRLTRA